MKSVLSTLAILVCIATGIVSPSSFAQGYPVKPVRIIIGFPPGGATDILTRDFAAKLGSVMGQQVIVENRPGAGGTIGADIVAKAQPDGYTLTVGTSSNHAISVSLYRKLPFDPLKDLAPITMLAQSHNVVVINKNVPANSLAELVAYAKANPGKLTFGSSGNGTISHLTGELFNTLNGTAITHIPYKGSAYVFPDLLSGQISMMYDSIISIQGLIKAGKVKPLAVTSLKRSKLLPDVPSVAELGYPGFESTNWFQFSAPAGTPREIIETLYAASMKVLSSRDLQDRFALQGAEVIANSPAEARAMQAADVAKWAEVAKQSGAKID